MRRFRIFQNSRGLLLILLLFISVVRHAYGVEGKIAFTSNRDGERAIYLMDGDGQNPIKLTEGNMPAWLPDGETIGFLYGGDIWMIDREGTDRRNITKGRFKETILYPDWSPDGSKIVYWSRVGGNFGTPDIYVMDADGRNPKNLTDDLHYDDSPSWSPDGRNVAFAAYLRPRGNRVESEIFVMDAKGDNRVNLTQNPRAKSRQVSWSPDGTRIAYSASPKPFLWSSPYNIYVVNADGTDPVLLTAPERWAYEYHPCWSPDSKKIAFSKYTPDGFHDIFTMNADGSELTNITQTHRVSEGYPAWSPAPQAVSSQGRLATRWGEVKQGTRLSATAK
ncbi:MAG: hypothetical protein OXN17_20355 [Candidatus Poribacteria bacterium]|nr:hypothetical protein [Candidatus Poribacteria bacterium]MDE0504309.1 hypothetical protein [Candidatus Poribacteria bacterium]